MGNYSMFYERSVSCCIGVIEDVADSLGIYITDTDIWELAKEHDELPHLGNVYQYILFSRLEAELKEKYPKLQTDYFINGMDSHFYVNGENLYSLEQFHELVEKSEV